MIKIISLSTLYLLITGCGSDIVRDIPDANIQCNILILDAKERLSKFTIPNISNNNINDKCKLMLMASDSYGEETMSLCRLLNYYHILYWAENNRGSIGWSIQNTKKYIDYKISILEYDYADDILSSAYCIARNTLIDLNNGRKSYCYLLNLDENSFRNCIKILESALLEKLVKGREIAQQVDAPEPATMIYPASQTSQRPPR